MTSMINFHGQIMTAEEAQAQAKAIMAGFDDLPQEDRDVLNYTERLGWMDTRSFSKNAIRNLRREMRGPAP